MALRQELEALKGAFARQASDIQVYTYTQTVYISSSSDVFTLTLLTDDGSNTIASVELEKSRRIPFSGGARWYIGFSLKAGEQTPAERTVVVRSMRKGRISIS